MPFYFTKTIGFEEKQWMQLLSFMFMSNIIWESSVRIHRRPAGMAANGGLVRRRGISHHDVAALLLSYRVRCELSAGHCCRGTLWGDVGGLRAAVGPDALAGAPEQGGGHVAVEPRGGGEQLGRPGDCSVVPACGGVGGVMWIYAVLYLISAVMTLFLTLPSEDEAPSDALAGGPDSVEPASTTVL